MSEELDRLKQFEERHERKESKQVAMLKRLEEQGGKLGGIDLDSKYEDMKEYKRYKTQSRGFVDSVIRGLTWGNIYVWDRSYETKYDFTLNQRMKIINYIYDRFSLRAGKVSREVSSFYYIPHEKRLKSNSIPVESS